MNKISLLLLFFIIYFTQAFADDTIEASPTGNIVFEKAPELIMQDESLAISKSATTAMGSENYTIDVDFHFKNISNHDITRTVAFVLPPVLCREDKPSSWGGLDSDEGNPSHGLKDFTTTVDNQPKPYTIRTEAMLGNQNITNLLTQLKIPLNPCKVQITAEGKPDPRYSENLQKYHLLTSANEAAWSENIYFEWTQIFPAGKIINIHHHYTTVTGGSVLSLRTIKELNEEFTGNNPPLKPIWNKNPETLSVSHSDIVKKNHSHAMRFCVMPIWVQYQLLTGANWNGGIGLFKLTITDESSQPFAVNQFYKNDTKVNIFRSNNTMTFTIQKFIPTQNLLIQFLSLPQTEEDKQVCA